MLEVHFPGFRGVATVDEWKPYGLFKTIQRCWARLLREAEALLSKEYMDADVPKFVSKLRAASMDLFTFTLYRGVKPTNNHAERQLRELIINSKIRKPAQGRERDERLRQADDSRVHMEASVTRPVPGIQEMPVRRLSTYSKPYRVIIELSLGFA